MIRYFLKSIRTAIFFFNILFFNFSLDSHYLNNISDFFYAKKVLNVGYISVKGVIADFEEVYFTIKKFEQDKAIDAIIIAMDSNGSYSGTGHHIANIVKRVVQKKPVVACVLIDATSAGYNIVSSCTWIVAQAATNIGGIGSVIHIPKKNDHISIGSGKFKKTIYKSEGILDDEYAEYMQERIDIIGGAAYKLVADNRGLPFEFIKGLESKYYTGQEVLELGLIDQVGVFEDALYKIVELVSIKNSKVYTNINLISATGTVLAEYDI